MGDTIAQMIQGLECAGTQYCILGSVFIISSVSSGYLYHNHSSVVVRVSKLRMSSSTPPINYMPSWRAV